MIEQRRLWLAMLAGVLGVLVGGCASFNQLSADVSTFGDWPAQRKPGTYAFERLPSQAARAEMQQQLEDAARPALEKAGFRAAQAGAEPELLVQVGARVSRADRAPWDDPLWWHGGFGRWHAVAWRGPAWGWGWRYETPRYDREVALLLRDRSSGKPIYEARASSEGFNGSPTALLTPMFAAAMVDFPAAGSVSPRSVSVPIAAP